MKEVGQLCKDYDLGLFLDGVSSFGAEEIAANEINLKAVSASANKCLHGAPGLAFVVAHKDQWERVPEKTSGVYFLYILPNHETMDGWDATFKANPDLSTVICSAWNKHGTFTVVEKTTSGVTIHPPKDKSFVRKKYDNVP